MLFVEMLMKLPTRHAFVVDLLAKVEVPQVVPSNRGAFKHELLRRWVLKDEPVGGTAQF